MVEETIYSYNAEGEVINVGASPSPTGSIPSAGLMIGISNEEIVAEPLAPAAAPKTKAKK